MTIITTHSELMEVCRDIDEGGRFSMDLEFIPERTYDPELCLVQVATDRGAHIIDPLVLRELDPLWERIANPDILKVLHAAEQDLILMYSWSQLIPKNIFDTQIAAGFIGFGYPVGYGKLVQQTLGVQLTKTESFTDWMNRPLTKSQIEYALDDVHHLLPLYDKIMKKLKAMERVDWVDEECRRYTREGYYVKDRSNDFFRIKGANNLNRRSLAVLRELTDWRHLEASKTNKPLRTILQDGTLLEFARRPPKEMADLQRVRGFRPDQARVFGAGLMKAVSAGLAVPDSELPQWPQNRIPSKAELLIADVLFTMLKVICYQVDIAAELVATRSTLEALARAYIDEKLDESSLPIVKGWRYDLAGKQLIQFLLGADLQFSLTKGAEPIKMLVSHNETAKRPLPEVEKA